MPRKSAAKSSSVGSYKGRPIERLTKAALIEVILAMNAKIVSLENERLSDASLLR